MIAIVVLFKNKRYPVTPIAVIISIYVQVQRMSSFSFMARFLDYSADDSFSNFNEHELIQYLIPVGPGPSSNT